MEKELNNLLDKLREFASNNVETKNEKVSKEEDLSKGEFDKVFDIDIFYSRKPSMRRSVQIIKSDLLEEKAFRLSAMTAILGLCDTMVLRGLLSKEDIKVLATALFEHTLDLKGGEK